MVTLTISSQYQERLQFQESSYVQAMNRTKSTHWKWPPRESSASLVPAIKFPDSIWCTHHTCLVRELLFPSSQLPFPFVEGKINCNGTRLERSHDSLHCPDQSPQFRGARWSLVWGQTVWIRVSTWHESEPTTGCLGARTW